MLINWELERKKGKLTKIILLVFLFIILSLQTFLINKTSCQKPIIVSIDSKAIIADFIRQQRSKELDVHQMAALIERFSMRLTHEVNRMAERDNLVFVPKQAIIAGGKDYTDIIKRQVLQVL